MRHVLQQVRISIGFNNVSLSHSPLDACLLGASALHIFANRLLFWDADASLRPRPFDSFVPIAASAAHGRLLFAATCVRLIASGGRFPTWPTRLPLPVTAGRRCRFAAIAAVGCGV